MGDETRTTRVAPIGWAQHWMWLFATLAGQAGARPAMSHLVVNAPDRLGPAPLRKALTRLSEQHEVLRTVYGYDRRGLPVQIVHPSVEPQVTVAELGPISAGRVSDLDRITAYLSPASDLATEQPLQAVLGLTGGTPRLVLVAVREIAVDGAGLGLLHDDLAELIAAELDGHRPRIASPGWQPVDQALAESQAQLRRTSQQSLLHWQRLMAAAPHSSLPFYRHEEGYALPTPQGLPWLTSLNTTVTSRELAARCLTATAKYQGTVPNLLLSLLATLLVGWTGHTACTVGSVAANRWEPRQVGSVGRYATPVRLFVDLAGDPPFSEIVRRAWSASLVAQRRGIHNVGEHVMAAARESLRRRARFATAVNFNYHDYLASTLAWQESTLLADPTVSQTPDPARTNYLRIDVTPIGESIEINLSAPTWLLPEGAAREFHRQLARLLDAVNSARDPRLSELTHGIDLPRPWTAAGWCSIRRSWISLRDVSELLQRHPGVADAAVFPVEQANAADPLLAAYVVPRHPDPAPSNADWKVDLDDHMWDLVSDHPSTMVPHRYLLCRSVPAEPADHDEWRALSVTALPSDGRRGPDAPIGPRERSLADAFTACHPDRPVRMLATYAGLDGEFLCIPAMLEHLERSGYGGLVPSGFTGMASLRRLASKLERQV